MPTTVLLGLAVFVVGVDTYIVAAVLPAIADDLGESISNVGFVASAYALPVALVVARVRTPLRPTWTTLRAAPGPGDLHRCRRCVRGRSNPAGAPASPGRSTASARRSCCRRHLRPPVTCRTKSARGRALALLSSAFPLSNLLGLPIGALATTLGGWRVPFALIVVLSVVAMAGVGLSSRISTMRTSDRGYAATFGRVLRDRHALAVMSVSLVWFTGSIGMFIYVGEFFHQTYGIPSSQAGLAYVVIGVVGIAAARSSGLVLERIGARRTVLVGISIFGVSVLLLPLTAVALPVSLVVLATWAFGTWFGVPGMQTIVAGLSNAARGTMLAFNGSALNLGGVIGPVISGRIIETGGFIPAGVWSAFLAACAIVIAGRVLPRHTSTPPAIEEPAGMV